MSSLLEDSSPTNNNTDLSSTTVRPTDSLEVDSDLVIKRFRLDYLNDEKVYILIIFRKDDASNIWVWIGAQEAPLFKYLSVSMQSKYSTSLNGALSTSVMGHSSMGLPPTSSGISERLTMKFKKVFIVSYNLKEDQDGQKQLFVEKNVFDIFKKLFN